VLADRVGEVWAIALQIFAEQIDVAVDLEE